MKTKKLLLNALPLLLIGTAMVYAAAPSGGYLPGATTDPACAPGDTDCVVQLPSETPNKFVDGTDTNDAVYTGTGNVGIGTDSPSTKLQVNGAIKAGMAGDSSYKSFMVLRNDGNEDQFINMYVNPQGTGVIESKKDLDIIVDQDNANIKAVKILENGNVGIGTTSPSAKLDIVSSSAGTLAEFRDGVASNFIIETAVNTTTIGNQAGSSQLAFKSSDTEAMRIAATGNVGIGTATPITQFHVRSSGAGLPNNSGTSVSAGTISRFETSTSNGVIDFGNNGSSSATWIQSHSKADQSATWRLALNPNGGNVGIGTTTPKAMLHINTPNDLSLTSTTHGLTIGRQDSVNIGIDNNEIMARNNGVASTLYMQAEGGDFIIHDHTSASTQFRVKDNGSVGIGTGSPTAKLSVNGSANKPGGGSWGTFSDARLKDISGDYTKGLDEISQLQPKKFNYKKDNALGWDSDTQYIGYIAQEVQTVFPEAVSTSDNGYLQLETQAIDMALINAIQELKEQNIILQKRIEILESK